MSGPVQPEPNNFLAVLLNLAQQADAGRRMPVQSQPQGLDVLARLLKAPVQSVESTPVPQNLQPQFRRWLKKNRVTDYGDPRSFYDYGGAFLAGLQRDAGAEGHFPDTFKMHGHPSFSDESQYATGTNNPHWFGEVLMRLLPQIAADATRMKAVR